MQSTMLHAISWHDGVVSLIMLPLILGVQRRSVRRALIIGGCCGFIEDTLCASGFAWTIATAAVMLFAYRTAEVVAMDRTLILVATVAVATFARDAIFWSIEYLGGSPLTLFAHHLHMSLWNTLFTSVAAALFAPFWMRYLIQARR